MTSFTIVVPAAVPSVIQTSMPVVGVNASNNTRPSPVALNALGEEPVAPGTMSRTSEVPAAVPSVIHSSAPAAAVVAAKTARPFPIEVV